MQDEIIISFRASLEEKRYFLHFCNPKKINQTRFGKQSKYKHDVIHDTIKKICKKNLNRLSNSEILALEV